MEILFRGFYADENGNEEIWTNGTCQGEKVKGKVNGEWIYWDKFGKLTKTLKVGKRIWGKGFQVDENDILPETVGQWTGLTDKNGKRIFVGDKALFLDAKYEVCFECGTFGIGSFTECFDYSLIQKQVKALTGNSYSGIGNDNFVSLWDIYWNFNDEEEAINEIEVIGTVFDKEE